MLHDRCRHASDAGQTAPDRTAIRRIDNIRIENKPSNGSGSAARLANRSPTGADGSSPSVPLGQHLRFRWAANDYGTVASRIDIVRAVASGEPFQTLSQVQPGGDILLSITGWPKVELVLHHIDAVETAGIDPCDAAPDHWRHVAHRMSVALRSARISERHNAWLRRREIER